MNAVTTIAKGVLKELIRRKDFYLILALLVCLVLFASSVSFGGEKGFQRYFKEVGITLSYIFSVIISATFGSRQVPQEIESKTIYPILARPVSRFEFITGKFFGVWIVSILSFTAYYSVFVLVLWLRGDRMTPVPLIAEGYYLHCLLLGIITAFTVFLSMALSAAANSVIVMILYFSTNWFGLTFPAYIVWPHPELFDIKEKIIHTQDIVPFWAMAFLTVYAVFYISIFLMSSLAVFKKKIL